MIKTANLNSSALTSAKYDTINHELRLTFKNGIEYIYPDIAEQHYDGLVTAESAGRYYNAVIKPLLKK